MDEQNNSVILLILGSATKLKIRCYLGLKNANKSLGKNGSPSSSPIIVGFASSSFLFLWSLCRFLFVSALISSPFVFVASFGEQWVKNGKFFSSWVSYFRCFLKVSHIFQGIFMFTVWIRLDAFQSILLHFQSVSLHYALLICFTAFQNFSTAFSIFLTAFLIFLLYFRSASLHSKSDSLHF